MKKIISNRFVFFLISDSKYCLIAQPKTIFNHSLNQTQRAHILEEHDSMETVYIDYLWKGKIRGIFVLKGVLGQALYKHPAFCPSSPSPLPFISKASVLSPVKWESIGHCSQGFGEGSKELTFVNTNVTIEGILFKCKYFYKHFNFIHVLVQKHKEKNILKHSFTPVLIL